MPLRPEYSKSGTELKPGVQQVGSAITYGRRYGLCAMAGVASADEDDDGNAAAATRGEARGARDEPTEAERKAKLERMEAEGRVRRVPPAPPTAPAEGPKDEQDAKDGICFRRQKEY